MLGYVLFVIGFALAIKGADFLVDGAASLARKLKVSDLFIGLTIVAFGTSTPELFVNLFAATQNTPDIAIGNILGSNIFNILIILGLSAIICPLSVTKSTAWKEIPLTLVAAVLVGILANDTLIDKTDFSALTKIDGLILIIFFTIFLYYIIDLAKRDVSRSRQSENKKLVIRQNGFIKTFLFIILGLVSLAVGSKWIVEGAVEIATILGISQSLIALTIVASGTSIPELATSVTAAYKQNADIAVGNIVGSNIFNILCILGLSSIILPLPFNSKNNIDISVTIFASLILFVSMFFGSKKYFLERIEGIIFIAVYVGYISFLIIRR